MLLKVALIGCGAIGTVLAQAIDEGRAGKAELAWIYDLKSEKSEELAKKLSLKPRIARGVAEIYADKTVDLVIEAASQLAVKQYSLDILRSGKDLMVMSVGAFADEKLLNAAHNAAEQSGRRIYIPSGAVLGIDGIKAAELGEIIIADPKLDRNVHKIRVRGKAGELVTEARNVSFPDVPRTSYLAALSAIQTLRNLSESIRVGT